VDKCIEKVECCGLEGDKSFQKGKHDLPKIYEFFMLLIEFSIKFATSLCFFVF